MPRQRRAAADGWDGRVLRHEGLLWKRRRGATSTHEEFLDARARFLALHEESTWNPWVLDERADEVEAAQAVMRQWRRAEPGFRPMTAEEVREDLERFEAEQAARHAETVRQRELRKAQYDPEREQTRRLLLEREGYVATRRLERQELRDGTRFPEMQPERRAQEIQRCEGEIAALEPVVERLRAQLGDPETVADRHGWLPADRREAALLHFSLRRQSEVSRLRPEIAELATALEGTRGRRERGEARRRLEHAQAQLDEWLPMPPPTADEMCSECPEPAAWHLTGKVTAIGWQAPCPGWPWWAERLDEVRAMVAGWASKREEPKVEPAPPEPLAVIPSGLPIAEVAARLTELQAQHPDAEVRRGKRDGWELWAPAALAGRPDAPAGDA